MKNIKLTIEYDGTDFCGWQEQPDLRTVQGEIKKSLSYIFQTDIKLTGSGRTDTGVHAAEQVANFYCHSDFTLYRIKAALNGTLPKDIRIINVEEVPSDFHARFNAKKREYHYQIAKYEKAINRYYSWFYKHKVDVELMHRTSQHLLGRHDFQSFCQSKSDVKHYICNVEMIKWEEKTDLIIFKIVANRFLHNMVRIIVGTILEIGAGKIEPETLKLILNAKDRRSAGPTIPAKGLILFKVYY